MDLNEKNSTSIHEVTYIPINEKENGFQSLQLENKDNPKDSIFLYISAFTADLLSFATGCALAWSSPALEKLKEADPNINPIGKVLTPLEESWIVALLCLGAAIGPLFAGKFSSTLGRKKALIITSLPMIVSYVTLAFATNIYAFFGARLVLGLGVGATFTVLPMYLAEITENHNRGKFGCIMAVFVTTGLLYPFAVGPLVSLRMFCLSCAVPPIIFLIFFTLFIPESPVFSISIGNVKEAKEAMKKLRNRGHTEVEKEFLEVTQKIENEKDNKGDFADLFKLPNLRRALAVSVGLITLQQFSGINAVLGFMGQIIDASGSGLSTYLSTILVGVIQVAATLLTSVTVEKLGRKFLLLVSSVGSCASIVLLGLYFYFKKNHVYNVDSLFWLPVLSLIIYIVSFNIGLGPLPWAVMGEIFPPSVIPTAAALTSFSCYFTSFIITLGFPIMAESVGMAQCFWLFGFCCVVGIFFIFYVVPETKGKTLSEIQEMLSHAKR